MTRTCEHCTFWKGNESSSRAECGNDDVMGTTAHDDTCKHFTAKAWAGNPQINDDGRIIGKIKSGGGLIWSNHQTSVAPGTPMYLDKSGRITTIPDQPATPVGIVGDDGRVIIQGSTTMPGSAAYSIDVNIDSHRSFDAAEIARHLNEYFKGNNE